MDRVETFLWKLASNCIGESGITLFNWSVSRALTEVDLQKALTSSTKILLQL